MPVPVYVLGPADWPVRAWLEADAVLAQTPDAATVIACAPEKITEHLAGTCGPKPLVACMLVSSTEELVADGAFALVGVRADAYASTHAGLREAVAFVAAEERDGRSRGPLRLTWLGALGQREARNVGPIGRSFGLDRQLIVGRSPDCIQLRHGPHSDSNTIARRHALIERVDGAVEVRCLASTNGTWVNGVRITRATLQPGDEVAFACTNRFRLDGAP